MATPLPPTVTAPPSLPTPPPVWKRSSRSGGGGGGGGQARRKEDHHKKEGRRGLKMVDLKKRAATGPVAAGYPDCSNVGNNQLSCFPFSNTTVIQDAYSKFIWNFNYPLFIANNNTVDIYLHLADSDLLVQSWKDLPNPEGQLAFSPDDAWWESMKKSDNVPEDGANQWAAYFVIVPGGHSLNGAEVHQSTFTANQTAVPSAVALSRISVSSTASVASASRAAAVASTSALSVSSVASSSLRAAATTGTNGSGSLQGSGGGDGFPRWATALLSVLGALLLLTALGLLFVFLRRMRRRNRPGSIGSLGSSSPMMGTRNAALGVTTGAAALGAGAAAGSSSDQPERAVSPSSPHTTASSHQNPQYAQFAPSSPTDPFNSTTSQASGRNAPSLTGADAASISAAYRSALSHPNFEEATPEGSTPEDEGAGGNAGAEMLQRELKAEGMVVRGVKGGRGGDVRDGGGA